MLFGKFVFLVLSLGSFSLSASVADKLLYPLYIKESSYHAVEHPDIFGIKPDSPFVQAQNCAEQMTPTSFAEGVASNYLSPTDADLATRQKRAHLEV
ncbi:MAG: hypothetical protein ACYC40_02580 [Patescibacteria group bacterium]